MTKKRIVGFLVLATILSSIAGYSFNDSAVEKGHLPNAPALTDF
ncbi:hypothetical protein [Terribacillus sp. 7520-G]|nr:hypothetical protein [Terribacillus sp. 7520-G]